VTLTASGAEIVQPPVVDDGDHSTTGHRQP